MPHGYQITFNGDGETKFTANFWPTQHKMMVQPCQKNQVICWIGYADLKSYIVNIKYKATQPFSQVTLNVHIINQSTPLRQEEVVVLPHKYISSEGKLTSPKIDPQLTVIPSTSSEKEDALAVVLPQKRI